MAFVDIAYKQTAYTELELLKMVDNNLDLYIAMFNRLLKQASFQETDQRFIDRFKKGLKHQLQVACLRKDSEPVTMEEWQTTARKENLIYLKIQQLVKNNPTYTHFQQKNFPSQK